MNERGLSVLDVLVVLAVLAVLLLASSREFARFQSQTIPEAQPTPAAAPAL